MFIPERRWLESHLAPRRKTRLIDVPALEFAPVVDGRFESRRLNLRVGRRCATEDPVHRDCNLLPPALLRGIRSADDALAELALVEAEDRGVRYGMEARQRVLTFLRNACSVHDKDVVEDCGMRRQVGDSHFQLLER